MDMREREMGLEEFGEFLLKRRIVPEMNAKCSWSGCENCRAGRADPKLSLEKRIDVYVGGCGRMNVGGIGRSSRRNGR